MHKKEHLDWVASVAHDHKGRQLDLDDSRSRLIDAIWQAKQAGATQLEIAAQTHFSRQRIAQFLKEAKESNAHAEYHPAIH